MQKLSLGGCKKFVRSRSQQMPKQRASAEAGSGQRAEGKAQAAAQLQAKRQWAEEFVR